MGCGNSKSKHSVAKDNANGSGSGNGNGSNNKNGSTTTPLKHPQSNQQRQSQQNKQALSDSTSSSGQKSGKAASHTGDSDRNAPQAASRVGSNDLNNSHNVAKNSNIYQSRIKNEAPTEAPKGSPQQRQSQGRGNGVEDVDVVVEEEPQQPSPVKQKAAPTFQAETNGVQWSNLYVDAERIQEAIIGHGSFGTVVRAKLRQYRNEIAYDDETQQPKVVQVITDVDVAVKVLTRSQTTMMSEKEFEKICDKAFQEVHVLQEAESRMLYRDCIIRTYGIARGALPEELSSLFGMQSGIEGVGIVMRFEGGGSLEGFLSRQRSLGEKLRILEGIARGLTELHGLGIIHSDIKPDNVLLSSDKPPEVRLADFGLSVFRDNKQLSKSSLVATTHSRGTPIYFAPEMLMNPYQVSQKKVIAQSSRKTDIYAFALLSWEVLTQNQAFFDVDTEGELCAKVHKGQRPPLEQIPRSCPVGVINTIKASWDTSRHRRKTAIECLMSYQFYYGIVSKKRFDIFYSHSPSKSPLSTFVMQHLIRLGYRVWFDQDDSDAMTATRQNALLDGINRSTVVIAFTNRAYQENMKCMFELKEARTMTPPKPIITLASEADPLSYSTKLFLDLSQIATKPFADVSGITTDLFDAEDVPSGEKLVSLQQMLQPVMRLLRDNDCTPSLDVLGKIAD